MKVRELLNKKLMKDSTLIVVILLVIFLGVNLKYPKNLPIDSTTKIEIEKTGFLLDPQDNSEYLNYSVLSEISNKLTISTVSEVVNPIWVAPFAKNSFEGSPKYRLVFLNGDDTLTTLQFTKTEYNRGGTPSEELIQLVEKTLEESSTKVEVEKNLKLSYSEIKKLEEKIH